MSWLLFAILAIVILVGFSAFTGAPYVPSHRRDVARAFRELYPLGANDVLVDIGSGDGVVLRQASKCGARAVGYEIHPLLVLLSRWLSRGDVRVAVYFANFWRVDLPNDTTAAICRAWCGMLRRKRRKSVVHCTSLAMDFRRMAIRR